MPLLWIISSVIMMFILILVFMLWYGLLNLKYMNMYLNLFNLNTMWFW